MNSPLMPTALYLEVAERLRQSIFSQQLPPGSWIDEIALASQYGISRTPMREALKVLAAEGLVTLVPRRGCFVTEISTDDLDEIFPLLALLEGRCLRESLKRVSADDITELCALHQDMEVAAREGNHERFFAINERFHGRVEELSASRWTVSLLQHLRKLKRLSNLIPLSPERRLQQALEEHRILMAAIHAHDPASAEAAMQQHILACLRGLSQVEEAAV